MTLKYTTLDSPIGELYLIACEANLRAVIFKNTWTKFKHFFNPIVEKDNKILKATRSQLSEYFKGKRQYFDLAYKIDGTDFQLRTWKALSKIPYAKTKSYKEIAIQIGSPNSVRAVGRTSGINPLCIIIPCHRVIGSNGSLTGYAGGLNAKTFLLDLEQNFTT